MSGGTRGCFSSLAGAGEGLQQGLAVQFFFLPLLALKDSLENAWWEKKKKKRENNTAFLDAGLTTRR